MCASSVRNVRYQHYRVSLSRTVRSRPQFASSLLDAYGSIELLSSMMAVSEPKKLDKDVVGAISLDCVWFSDRFMKRS